MRYAAGVRSAVCIMAMCLAAPTASAQSSGQLWSNITVDWLQSDRLTLTLDVEPKVVVQAPAGRPGWTNVDVSPSLAFTLASWVDATAEVVTGYTRSEDGDGVVEATTRVGFQLEILSRLLAAAAGHDGADRERPPRRRLVIGSLIRAEFRNRFAVNGATISDRRLRERIELAFPINRRRMTADRTLYGTADGELFVPMNDAAGWFVNQYRIRAGIGYRYDFNWRFEALLIRTQARETAANSFSASAIALDLRIKRAF